MAGQDPPLGTGVNIASGGYTGDGTAGQSITGLGFAPEYVYITARDGSAQVVSWGDMQPVTVNTTTGSTDSFWIDSLDDDGFTVSDSGADQTPNANGVDYTYVAIG